MKKLLISVPIQIRMIISRSLIQAYPYIIVSPFVAIHILLICCVCMHSSHHGNSHLFTLIVCHHGDARYMPMENTTIN